MPYRDSQHAYPLHQRRWACIRLPRKSFSPADRRIPNGPIRCRNDGRRVPQNPRSVRETEHAYLLLLGDRCARPFAEHHGRSAVLACCAMFLAMQLTQWLTHCQRFDVPWLQISAPYRDSRQSTASVAQPYPNEPRAGPKQVYRHANSPR